MVQAVWTPRFLDTETFGGAATMDFVIGKTYEVSGSNGRKELQAELLNKEHHVKMSIYGDNLKRLIDGFGGETDNWNGKPVRVTLQQKGDRMHKVINVLEKGKAA